MLDTVNVIRFIESYDPSTVVSLNSFPETKEGNEAAEKLFVEILRVVEPDLTEEDISTTLDNGCSESETNGMVILTHST